MTPAMASLLSPGAKAEARLLHSVLRRRAKAARTVRKKKSFPQTGAAGGAARLSQRMTAEVTLGAGRKQEGGTSKRSSTRVWYCM